MDEKPGSLVSVIIGERIKADTPLPRHHSTFYSLAVQLQHHSHLCFPALMRFTETCLDNTRPKISTSNQLTMANARSLSIFLVAVLVACCFCVAQGAVTGTILSRTLLQVSPGAGTTVLTTLTPRTVVIVMCRTQSDVVFDDPWWLKVSVPVTGMNGWVADYYVDCGDVGNCIVAQC